MQDNQKSKFPGFLARKVKQMRNKHSYQNDKRQLNIGTEKMK